jgi:hypothetical protein
MTARVTLHSEASVYVVATRVRAPHSDEAQSLFEWYDAKAIPAHVAQPGIAGAWDWFG